MQSLIERNYIILYTVVIVFVGSSKSYIGLAVHISFLYMYITQENSLVFWCEVFASVICSFWITWDSLSAALSLKKCLHNWTSLILGFTTDEKIQDRQSHFFHISETDKTQVNIVSSLLLLSVRKRPWGVILLKPPGCLLISF